MIRRRPDDGLRALFRKHLSQVHWVSVETGLTESGVPDLEGCYKGVSLWLECKATQAWAVKIRPFQIGWHLRRQRAGGRTFVAVRRRVKLLNELWLYEGGVIIELSKQGLRLPPIARFEGGPARWDWDRVLFLLVNCERPDQI